MFIVFVIKIFSFIDSLPLCPDNVNILQSDGNFDNGDRFQCDDHIRYPDDFANHVDKIDVHRLT